MKKVIVILALSSIANFALAESKTVMFKDKVNVQTHKVIFNCESYDFPRLYTCNKQEIVFDNGMRYTPSNVPKEKDGSYRYWISSLGHIAANSSDIYQVVSYLDTSGSASGAVEKYEILEYSKDGKLKSKFGLMSYQQYQQKLKKLHPDINVTYEGGLE